MKDFVCNDVRLDFMSLECHPTPHDEDAVLAIVLRDDDDRFALAAGLGRDNARALADYIDRVLS